MNELTSALWFLNLCRSPRHLWKQNPGQGLRPDAWWGDQSGGGQETWGSETRENGAQWAAVHYTALHCFTVSRKETLPISRQACFFSMQAFSRRLIKRSLTWNSHVREEKRVNDLPTYHSHGKSLLPGSWLSHISGFCQLILWCQRRKSGSMSHGVALYLFRGEGVTQDGYILEAQGFWPDSHLHGMLGQDAGRGRSCSTLWEAISSFRRKGYEWKVYKAYMYYIHLLLLLLWIH